MAKQDEPAKVIYSMVGVGNVHGTKQVLTDIYLVYFYGAKIGAIGLNGPGKTTLLKIMAGIGTNYPEDVACAPGYSVGCLEKEPKLDPEKTVIEIVREGAGEAASPIHRQATPQVVRRRKLVRLRNQAVARMCPRVGFAGSLPMEIPQHPSSKARAYRAKTNLPLSTFTIEGSLPVQIDFNTSPQKGAALRKTMDSSRLDRSFARKGVKNQINTSVNRSKCPINIVFY